MFNTICRARSAQDLKKTGTKALPRCNTFRNEGHTRPKRNTFNIAAGKQSSDIAIMEQRECFRKTKPIVNNAAIFYSISRLLLGQAKATENNVFAPLEDRPY